MEGMDRRVFLGWNEPVVGLVAGWLLERREQMPGMVVVVPTAQSGRRLREVLAESGPCLAPRVVTPGWFMDVDCAPPAAEVLAWVEALESVVSWEPFAQVFPVPPGGGEEPGWSLALARSLLALERSLQEAALTLESAARRMGKSIDAGRWAQLADLWRRKEARLSDWEMTGRSRVIEARSKETVDQKVVLAAVPDLPDAVARRLEGGDFLCLIGAPEGSEFDAFGRPLPDAWAERELPFPAGVGLAADPREQASMAVRLVAEHGMSPADLALGSADEQVAEALVEAFGRAGWMVHNPAGTAVSPVRTWLALWRAWLRKPVVAAAVDLLGLQQTAGITGGMRHQRVRELGVLRDQWLVRTLEDVKRAEAMAARRMEQREPDGSAFEPKAVETMERLEVARSMFLRQPFGEAMERLLERVDPEGQWVEVRDWLARMSGLIAGVKRDAGFWLDLLVAELGDGVKEVPDERVADVHGWLELLHEPGRHVVVCGMNEGKVPGGAAGDTWLTDGVRQMLGITTDRRRAARDAYVFHALIASRQRVDVLLGKSGADGDALLPSRLLLAAKGAELARRVRLLFREVEPPEAGICWVADWKWRLPTAEVKPRLGVTALRDYLSCPLRFFLKHGVNLHERDGERVEWNPRDFGNVLHLVLERWGRDPEARDFSRTEALAEWLERELERVVAELYGSAPPLAVRIQQEGARLRLGWFAREQACQRAGGWQVHEVERKFVIDVEGFELVGKVDRIDRHEDGSIRVLDYKTFNKRKEVEGDHRVEIKASTVLPGHLEGVDAVLCRSSKGKPARWTNLQVPLYAGLLGTVDELGYFVLAATEADSGLSLWQNFGEADRDSAMECARWVIRGIKAGVFGPAAERVEHDDFEMLAMGRAIGEVVEGGALP